MTQEQSPSLSQLTSPTTLEELFDKDPLLLTDSDVEKIVQELRAKRLAWAIEEQQARTAGTRPKPSAGVKAPKPDAASKKAFLANLDIKLG